MTLKTKKKFGKKNNQHLKTIALKAYSRNIQQPLDDQWARRYLPMVRRIAQRVVWYLKPPLSFEDLVSAGTLGLIKAARNFKPDHQAEFETYAYIKIKGAILDELRSNTMLPTNVNKKVRNAIGESRKITQQTGTPPSDQELAEKLGVSVEELYETYENARAQYFVSMESSEEHNCALGEFLADNDTTTPDKKMERSELVDKLAQAIRKLPERERQIILLYYQQQLAMKEIAQIFEITESRVSQLHAGAIFKLSTELRQWKNGG